MKFSKSKRGLKTSVPFVRYSTIWNAVGGGFSYPGDKKIVKVGKYSLLVERSNHLDRFGNVVHTATYIKKDGSFGSRGRTNGSAVGAVSEALKKEGIETRYKHITYKKNNL